MPHLKDMLRKEDSFNPKQHPEYKCKCGSSIFQQMAILKEVDPKKCKTEQKIVTFLFFACNQCGEIAPFSKNALNNILYEPERIAKP